MEERELQWTNPSLQFPFPEALAQALKYLRALLSSTDYAHLMSLCQKLTMPQRLDYSIAPRRRTILNCDWGSLPDRPSPLAVDRATNQLSIERYLAKRAAARANVNTTHNSRIVLNFPARGRSGASRHRATHKRGRVIIIEPLRGSDAPGDKASIQQVLALSEPRRVRHGRRSSWAEEFLVQRAPEYCTFGEALEQYCLEFDIESITMLESTVPSQDLLPFVAIKRPTKELRRSLRRPPLSTSCVV
jgi:hypothetical protein